jgi:RNA polymerase sigma-70 factor (ECF subfamily)
MRAEPFMKLIEPNLRPLQRYVASAMRNMPEVDDIVQQTVLKAFVHLDQFRSDAQFNTWLRAIALNEIRQFHRERQRHALRQENGDAVHFEVPDRRESAQTAWERKENAQALRRAIGRLPSMYRTVIELRYLRGLSLAETAERLSVGVGAVKTRLHRARQQLKVFMLDDAQPREIKVA